MEQIQYVSDENSNITAVIVPIDFWKRMELKKDCPETGEGREACRNFGKMRDKVKIIGDVISPVSDESEWEVLGL
ncbi:MAG: hypothetical protein V2I97_09300 [Desulfococcaceae bacterium]|jgi:hypothetical protein|nr:hypothetical protein [Desulfococcaceae bacterium]